MKEHTWEWWAHQKKEYEAARTTIRPRPRFLRVHITKHRWGWTLSVLVLERYTILFVDHVHR